MPPKSEVVALKGVRPSILSFRIVRDFPWTLICATCPLSGRDEAFRDIRENMEAIKSEIEKFLPGAEVSISENCKALVRNGGMLVKIEINEVVRRTLLPPVRMPLCPLLEKEFGGGMTVNCLSEAELYASKFCAALQRQASAGHIRRLVVF